MPNLLMKNKGLEKVLIFFKKPIDKITEIHYTILTKRKGDLKNDLLQWILGNDL